VFLHQATVVFNVQPFITLFCDVRLGICVQVQIFTRDGAFIRKFGSHILQNPRGVTVDRLGNIIVVECKVQRVIVFCQQTGTILHKFSIMETVEFPNGVAANNGCDKIYISDNQSHCVKV